jgi:hypothetical protein
MQLVPLRHGASHASPHRLERRGAAGDGSRGWNARRYSGGGAGHGDGRGAHGDDERGSRVFHRRRRRGRGRHRRGRHRRYRRRYAPFQRGVIRSGRGDRGADVAGARAPGDIVDAATRGGAASGGAPASPLPPTRQSGGGGDASHRGEDAANRNRATGPRSHRSKEGGNDDECDCALQTHY